MLGSRRRRQEFGTRLIIYNVLMLKDKSQVLSLRWYNSILHLYVRVACAGIKSWFWFFFFKYTSLPLRKAYRSNYSRKVRQIEHEIRNVLAFLTLRFARNVRRTIDRRTLEVFAIQCASTKFAFQIYVVTDSWVFDDFFSF